MRVREYVSVVSSVVIIHISYYSMLLLCSDLASYRRRVRAHCRVRITTR